MRRQKSRLDPVYAWVLPVEQDQRALAGQLLPAAAAQLLDVPIEAVRLSRDRLGRPVAELAGHTSEQVWLSASYHAGALAIAASLAGPIGIDLEGPRMLQVLQLARRWFADAEASWLAERPVAEQLNDFLLLWTAKEAFGKALGSGLRGAGLTRRPPLPPVTGDSLLAGPDGLRLAQPALAGELVLAVAAGPDVRCEDRVLLTDLFAHEELARSWARSRSSLPVVVRGS
jgi:4'-phosphopantetheinyl transferase